MRLLSSATSPYSRKVRVALIELGMDKQVELVEVQPFESTPELTNFNPLSKVPALIIPEQDVLFDSSTIIQYLNRFNEGVSLCPTDDASPRELVLEPMADGMTDAAFAIVMERRRPPTEQSTLWLDRWFNAISRSLKTLSESLPDGGDRFGVGQIAAACSLEYLDFRLHDFEWRRKYPKLADWVHIVGKRNSMKATQPKNP